MTQDIALEEGVVYKVKTTRRDRPFAAKFVGTDRRNRWIFQNSKGSLSWTSVDQIEYVIKLSA